MSNIVNYLRQTIRAVGFAATLVSTLAAAAETVRIAAPKAL